MSKQRKALQAALEAMEYLESQPHVRGKDDCYEDLIAEIRAALAEQQEPPTDQDIEEHIDGLAECWRLIGAKEAMRGMNMYGPQDAISERGLRKSEIKHRRAIRAALAEPYADKAKQFSGTQLRIDPMTGNVGIGTVALAEPESEQEPVAWKVIRSDGGDVFLTGEREIAEATAHTYWTKVPLYAAPLRREWVGLTDEEIEAAWKSCDPKKLLPSFAAAIEAKLKEKNA